MTTSNELATKEELQQDFDAIRLLKDNLEKSFISKIQKMGGAPIKKVVSCIFSYPKAPENPMNTEEEFEAFEIGVKIVEANIRLALYSKALDQAEQEETFNKQTESLI